MPAIFARFKGLMGKKAMSRGFSGGKQMIKAANARNRGRVCLLYTTENKEIFHNKDDNGKLWIRS